MAHQYQSCMEACVRCAEVCESCAGCPQPDPLGWYEEQRLEASAWLPEAVAQGRGE